MFENRLSFATAIFNEAAEITRTYFLSPRVEISIKLDCTPVTESDKNAEARPRGELSLHSLTTEFLARNLVSGPEKVAFAGSLIHSMALNLLYVVYLPLEPL
ncbi:MAG: hypothetical protein NTV34_21945 [Proteobacteria bacterium]|nr:hypothetical protein [Pseudomonadota bacterium]